MFCFLHPSIATTCTIQLPACSVPLIAPARPDINDGQSSIYTEKRVNFYEASSPNFEIMHVVSIPDDACLIQVTDTKVDMEHYRKSISTKQHHRFLHQVEAIVIPIHMYQSFHFQCDIPRLHLQCTPFRLLLDEHLPYHQPPPIRPAQLSEGLILLSLSLSYVVKHCPLVIII